MAAIIDGSTYAGFFKITQDHASPNAYYIMPKHGVFFQAVDATTGSIKTLGNTDLNISTGADTEDENGNALDTSAKVARYLSDNKAF